MPKYLDPKEDEILNRIIDLLAEEKCELRQAERILECVVYRIRGSSLVQDSSHKNGLPHAQRKRKKENCSPFSNLPFGIYIGVD